jgi:hypothetical protein
MRDENSRPPAEITGKTLPLRKALELVKLEPQRRPALYDRASIAFPQSVKNAAREVLTIYCERLSIGPGKLSTIIMGGADKRLTKDHLKHWLSGESSLGDARFQYVDRFVRSLDFEELGVEIQRIIRRQNEVLLRDSLTRFHHVRSYEDLPELPIYRALSRSVHGGLFHQRAPSVGRSGDTGKPSDAVLILLFTGEVTDGFAPVSITATALDEIDFKRHYTPEDIIRDEPLDAASTIRLYTGYIFATAPMDSPAHDQSWGHLVLKAPAHPTSFEAGLPALTLPESYCDMFGTFRIQVHAGRPVRTSFRLRFPNDLNSNYEEPGFRPWHRRGGQYTPISANEWYSLPANIQLQRLAAKFAIGWEP